MVLDSATATATRDALSKTLYNLSFDWLVGRVNAATLGDRVLHEISLLDIFGFESFRVNRSVHGEGRGQGASAAAPGTQKPTAGTRFTTSSASSSFASTLRTRNCSSASAWTCSKRCKQSTSVCAAGRQRERGRGGSLPYSREGLEDCGETGSRRRTSPPPLDRSTSRRALRGRTSSIKTMRRP